jgi:hypothetical protein|tara:strand:- start:477 stop:734 length:258 start_codon:yes stop_codon:yes gene_type:complete
MPDPSIKSLLSDIELVEYAGHMADMQERQLKEVKDDTIRDAKVIRDTVTGEQISVPNKFIRSIGVKSAFELMRPDLFQEFTEQNS